MQFDGASSSSEGPPAFKDGEPAEHQSAPMSRHTQFLSATNEPLHLYVGADQQNKSNHSPGQDTGESSGDGGRVVTRSKRTAAGGSRSGGDSSGRSNMDSTSRGGAKSSRRTKARPTPTHTHRHRRPHPHAQTSAPSMDFAMAPPPDHGGTDEVSTASSGPTGDLIDAEQLASMIFDFPPSSDYPQDPSAHSPAPPSTSRMSHPFPPFMPAMEPEAHHGKRGPADHALQAPHLLVGGMHDYDDATTPLGMASMDPMIPGQYAMQRSAMADLSQQHQHAGKPGGRRGGRTQAAVDAHSQMEGIVTGGGGGGGSGGSRISAGVGGGGGGSGDRGQRASVTASAAVSSTKAPGEPGRGSRGEGTTATDKQETLNRRREERNRREQRRSNQISKQIEELKDILSKSGCRTVGKQSNKFTILHSAAEFIRDLQQQNRNLAERREELSTQLSRAGGRSGANADGAGSSTSQGSSGGRGSLQDVHYRHVFVRAAVPMAIANMDGLLVDCNMLFTETCGVSLEELSHVSMFGLIQSEDLQQTFSWVGQVLRTRENAPSTLVRRSMIGREPMSLVLSYIRNEMQEPILFHIALLPRDTKFPQNSATGMESASVEMTG